MNENATKTPLDMMIAIAGADDNEELEELRTGCLTAIKSGRDRVEKMPARWWRARRKVENQAGVWMALDILIVELMEARE